MFAERPPLHNLAYLHDIPGTRVGPEDGPWPRSYQVLDDSEIWKELSALARPQSWSFRTSGEVKRVDSLNFQPCPRTRTQDRYVVKQLDIHGKMWTLTAVFDGHLGEVTVEHVAHHLPIIIRDSLRNTFHANPTCRPTIESISDLLSHAITSFDDAISRDVLDIFPGGMAKLSQYSDAELRYTLNDHHAGGRNYKKARLCMYGTTALVVLVDPEQENLWIANVGDCQAILVSSDLSGDWNVEVLTNTHNGDNDAEVERVRREHPGEPECVVDGRVLGALAPTRCMGDVAFKQPPEFTRRILYNLLPGFHDTSPWEEFLMRNRTPPYISATPDITHRRLPHCTPASPQYLILNSDGFTDLVHDKGQQRVVSNWARQMILEAQYPDRSQGLSSDNMALRLLRQALGGEDGTAVSAVLTLDMDTPWIDDTTVVVQQL